MLSSVLYISIPIMGYLEGLYIKDRKTRKKTRREKHKNKVGIMKLKPGRITSLLLCV